MLERVEREHGGDGRLAQVLQERRQVLAGAFLRREDALGRHEHRQVGLERRRHARGTLNAGLSVSSSTREAPDLVILARGRRGPRGTPGSSRSGRCRGAPRAAAAAARRARAKACRSLRDHRVEPGARPQQVGGHERHGEPRRARAREPPAARERRPRAPRRAPRRRRSRRRPGCGRGAPRAPRARTPAERTRRAKDASGPGKTTRRSGDCDEQRPEGGGRERPACGGARPSASAWSPSAARSASARCTAKNAFTGKRKTRSAGTASTSGVSPTKRPSATTSPRRAARSSRRVGRAAPAGARHRERQHRGAQVQAQHVREAAREEVRAPPLVREVRGVAEQAAHERLDEGERVDRVGEHDVGRESPAARAALELARDEHEHGRGERRGEREGRRERAPPRAAAAAAAARAAAPAATACATISTPVVESATATASAVAASARRPPSAEQPHDAEHHERRPGRGLDVDVEIDGREVEAAERVDEGAAAGRRRAPARARGARAGRRRARRAARAARAAARGRPRSARGSRASRAGSRARAGVSGTPSWT